MSKAIDRIRAKQFKTLKLEAEGLEVKFRRLFAYDMTEFNKSDLNDPLIMGQLICLLIVECKDEDGEAVKLVSKKHDECTGNELSIHELSMPSQQLLVEAYLELSLGGMTASQAARFQERPDVTNQPAQVG